MTKLIKALQWALAPTVAATVLWFLVHSFQGGILGFWPNIILWLGYVACACLFKAVWRECSHFLQGDDYPFDGKEDRQ